MVVLWRGQSSACCAGASCGCAVAPGGERSRGSRLWGCVTAQCGEEVSEELSTVALPLLQGGHYSQELWLCTGVSSCDKDPSHHLLSLLGDRD